MSSRVRKSSRLQNQEDQTRYREASSDSEALEFESGESDEEYVVSSNKRGKRPIGRSKTIKKQRVQSRVSRIPVSLRDLGDDFEENGLYKALSKPEISVYDLALEWVEEFGQNEEEGKNDAFTSLFNLLLRCCGCVSLAASHDLVNLDSASETIAEISMMFEKQKFHEYPFISNNKNLKFFKKNVIEFFDKLIDISHEKGILYKDPNAIKDDADADDNEEVSLASSFMIQALTWLSSLSSCNIRPFRYVSTVIVLNIHSKLCDLILNVTSSLEKQQRQLSNTKSSSKSKKNKKAHEKKVEVITNSIQLYHNQKETILEYFTDIVDTVFIHRYRDVDPLIRSECLKCLGYWMITYPDHFFQSSFLRYFGWLLSDPSEQVRSEVTKVLLKLYKNSNQNDQNMGISFRQFTERFKKQLINMIKKDKDFNVKFNLANVLCELLRAGFLDESDIYDVALNIFYIIENGSGSGITNDNKMKQELARFIYIANCEKVNNQLEKYTIFMDNYDSPQFGDEPGKLTLKDCFQVQNLIHILKTSSSTYSDHKPKNNNIIDNFPKSQDFPISIAFKTLYGLPSYTGSWEFLARYLLYDLSSITFLPKDENFGEDNIEVSELKSLLELKADDRIHLFELLYGAVSAIFDKKIGKKTGRDETDDIPSNTITKLVNYLPSLSKIMCQSTEQFHIFLKLWNLLVDIPSHDGNLYAEFNNLGQSAVFNDIMDKIIDFYRNFEINDYHDSPLLKSFDDFFDKLLMDYNNITSASHELSMSNNDPISHVLKNTSSGFSVNSETRLLIQNLLQELVAEARDAFNSSSTAGSMEDDDIEDDDLEDQKIVCNSLIEVAKPLLKLNKLGNFIDINEYVSQIGSSSGISVIGLISIKLLNKINLQPLYQLWPNNFLKIIDKFIQAFRVVIDTTIISNCWNLDTLIQSSVNEKQSTQSSFDIEILFDDVSTIMNQLDKLVMSLDAATSDINENLLSYSESLSSCSTKIVSKFCELKTLFSAKLIDLMVSLKVFYVKFKDENNFKGFNEFFTDNEGVGKYICKAIPESLQTAFLNVFLQKEARLAALINVQLDRSDNEDVNFDDLDFTEEDFEVGEKMLEKSEFDDESSDEEDNSERSRELAIQEKIKELKIKQKRQLQVWKAEKDLCVYSIKIFSLVNSGMVDSTVVNRLKLNSEKIGGLYYNIVQQNEKSMKEANAEPIGSINAASENDHSGINLSMAVEKDKSPATNPTELSVTPDEFDEVSQLKQGDIETDV